MEWIPVALKILAVISVLILLVETCFLGNFYSYDHGYGRNYSESKDKKRMAWIIAISILSFFGLVFFFSAGFDLFIPRNWGGYDEDGDWRSLSSSLGAICSVAFMTLLGQFEKIKRENVALKNQVEAEIKFRKDTHGKLENLSDWANIHNVQVKDDAWHALFCASESKKRVNGPNWCPDYE